MAEGGYPSVYVVDSFANRPPVPPRLSQRRRRAGVAQTLLFLLVSLALGGMAIEACFIYRLYRAESDTSASSSKQVAGEDDTSPTERPRFCILPSKPVAHLTDGQDVVHRDQTMAWSTVAEPILCEMDYEDGSLVIQKEGYYYVYSKVSFSDFGVFRHSVERRTKLYVGKSITLLKSRKYGQMRSKKMQLSNSYLGGVFHLHKDDAIFVKVSNTSQVARSKSFENIFGAFMI
ncbi:tumor necrosis factor ligand superfamily member 14 [Pagrus major]|uniref:tumor necrosis factor ligand superfamily member 14 n=1 Tax=Pagrus major TaxID=143350 RepID=UPI003CC8A989